MRSFSEFPAARPDRHATALMYDVPDCRVVQFTLAPHQEVAAHTSASSVIATVVAGSGRFSGADGEVVLESGATVAYAPNEPHGMVAGSDGLKFLVVIAPRP